MTQGTWGSWNCVIQSFDDKGNIINETKIGNPKGIYLDHEELLEMAIEKLGIELEYNVNN